MTLFKKKGVEIVDLTELQKKGILERSLARQRRDEMRGANENEGFVDLSKFGTGAKSFDNSGGVASPLGFLDSLASANNSSGGVAENPHELGSFKDAEVNQLKIKIEDLEYKLERVLERLSELEKKEEL